MSKKQISAKIVADSITNEGNRITTFILEYPKYLNAEVNTHRAFSRNSASSRAIPFKKMVKSVKTDPFIPIAWQKDHSGMQGSEYYTKKWQIWGLTKLWLFARNLAVFIAVILNKVGLTKQLCNRLLEPFMWHTAIVTATDWENFFSLRAQEAAEIHFQKLAYMMLEEINKSNPVVLLPGEWHVPFENEMDLGKLTTDARIKVATARCARVSYTVVGEEGKPANYENDIKLHDRLLASGHLSPFEHCATPMTDENGPGQYSGNFRGWIQYRKTLPNENRPDSRIIKN